MDRVQPYDMVHRPEKAWNTLADMIGHLRTDLLVMRLNPKNVGPFPADIQDRLSSLRDEIDRALCEDEEDDYF